MKREPQRFFKRSVIFLNGAGLILILVNVLILLLGHRIPFLKLMWDLVCLAVLVFVDTCQKNVASDVKTKPVGIVLVNLFGTASVVMIVLSLV